MNIEIIDKWLDNEYGVSYTRLEELHDFLIEQDIKHQEEKDKEIEKLHSIIKEVREYIKDKKAIIDTNQILIFNLFEIKEQGYISKLLEILDKVGDSSNE